MKMCVSPGRWKFHLCVLMDFCKFNGAQKEGISGWGREGGFWKKNIKDLANRSKKQVTRVFTNFATKRQDRRYTRVYRFSTALRRCRVFTCWTLIRWCHMCHLIDWGYCCTLLYTAVNICCRSQWPCGLRRGSTAARLLGLRVRIPPTAWMSVVSVVCCQVEVSATGWSLVQRSPTECGVCECGREASILRRPRPPRGCRAIGKNIYYY
jgi:hypothetical protein